MKRLTWRDKNGVAYPRPWVLLPTLDETMGLLCGRLAAYEDTGMEPEDVSDFTERWQKVVEIAGFIKENDVANHLRELVQAEQDGRLLVFPTKTAFEITWMATAKCDLVCPQSSLYDDSCKWCFKAEPHIREIQFRQEHMPLIGKTVFLSREETEAALEERRGQNDVAD